ncbi:hypothetical protein H0H81_007820 [Sphagnurus paluster]|uniref:Glucose-methanol-choline oxidoreductase N-terminal domain-containing protein n=1 Tax=Sphagnurus paluster TaxID=117069 RepID=A0A9P7KJ65_9AGAR|nr:hypothetical protein H0H81_007820 [Sphagnurus paluster]
MRIVCDAIPGGNTGNVVASRLSENIEVNVLVLEAGPSNFDVIQSEVPFLGPELAAPNIYNWNFTTVPQKGLGGREIPYPRGHILGGSSSINWMLYTRGPSSDFDRYASYTGESSWSWCNMLPHFKRIERWTQPADGHNTTGQYTPEVHGYNGKLAVGLSGYPRSIDGDVIEAMRQAGGVWKFNQDYNSGNPLGFGWLQTTIDKSRRSSSATAYLPPAVLQRSNLYVLVNTQVSRVLQTSSSGSTPAFRGVEFRASGGGPLTTLTANKEVVISAGTVGTPHILLNSGIGNTTRLQQVGVEPLVDLPEVGENMADHSVLGNPWFVNSTDTFETLRRSPALEAAALAQWHVNGTGPYVDTVVDHIGFMRISDNLVPNPDPASGPNAPHYEVIVSNGIPPAPAPATGNFLVLTTVVVSPTSRGCISLASSDPFTPPLIDPALLSTAFDRTVMREAVRTVIRYVSMPAWSGYVLSPISSALETNATDAMIDDYVRDNAGTLFHPVGTAAMSPKGANNGVTDPDGRVKKVHGLRVADLSVLVCF